MKTYKESTLAAVRKLICKYENPYSKLFFNAHACPLCVIYLQKNEDGSCRGCFMANRTGDTGCISFESYYSAYLYNKLKARADFHKKVLPILESWPEERFHPDTWTYTGDEISRRW